MSLNHLQMIAAATKLRFTYTSAKKNKKIKLTYTKSLCGYKKWFAGNNSSVLETLFIQHTKTSI